MMLMSTSNQAYIFLSAIYMGIIIGIIYDLYRAISGLAELSRPITVVMDILFWIIVTILSIVGFFYVSSGEIRAYSIIGLALGWLLYILTISRYMRRLLTLLCKSIILICNKLLRCLAYPFQWIIDVIEFPKRLWQRYKKICRERFIRTKMKDDA